MRGSAAVQLVAVPGGTGALADWSAGDRQTLGRLLGRFADGVTAHLAAIDDE